MGRYILEKAVGGWVLFLKQNNKNFFVHQRQKIYTTLQTRQTSKLGNLETATNSNYLGVRYNSGASWKFYINVA